MLLPEQRHNKTQIRQLLKANITTALTGRGCKQVQLLVANSIHPDKAVCFSSKIKSFSHSYHERMRIVLFGVKATPSPKADNLIQAPWYTLVRQLPDIHAPQQGFGLKPKAPFRFWLWSVGHKFHIQSSLLIIF